MKRTLVLTVGAGLLAFGAGCGPNEHGDAPPGQHAPGGISDDMGNAATSRALGETTPPRDTTRSADATVFNRWDAGGLNLEPRGGGLQQVDGRVASVSEGSVRIVPEQGAPVQLQLDQNPVVTLGGSLVAADDLREGAQVRAQFTEQDGDRIAIQMNVEQTPDEGRGEFQQGLQPPAEQPQQRAP